MLILDGLDLWLASMAGIDGIGVYGVLDLALELQEVSLFSRVLLTNLKLAEMLPPGCCSLAVVSLILISDLIANIA